MRLENCYLDNIMYINGDELNGISTKVVADTIK